MGYTKEGNKDFDFRTAMNKRAAKRASIMKQKTLNGS